MKKELNILWASMSGNAENVANILDDKAQKLGFVTNKVELNDVNMTNFSKMKNVAIVTSTTGEGDLPTNGEYFWEDLKVSQAELKNLNYSV